MVKDIREHLLEQAKKFHQWQETASHSQWFDCLCRRAAASNENEAKW